MLPLSTNSLQAAHTTLHHLSRCAVSSAVQALLCLHSKGLRALRPYAVHLSPAPLPLSLRSTLEQVVSPIIGARLIACAYRSRSLDSHSRVELFYRVTILPRGLELSRSLHAGDPLGSKPRSIASGVNPTLLGRRKIFGGAESLARGWPRAGVGVPGTKRPAKQRAISGKRPLWERGCHRLEWGRDRG